MIIDSNAIFLDSVEVTAEAVTSNAVGLTSLLKPGRAEFVHMVCKVQGADFAGGTSLEIKMQEADTENGTYTDVIGSTITIATANLTLGASIGYRIIPPRAEKCWLRLVVTPTGTFTAGKLFAAVVREEELDYVAGMYIDKGVVQC